MYVADSYGGVSSADVGLDGRLRSLRRRGQWRRHVDVQDAERGTGWVGRPHHGDGDVVDGNPRRRAALRRASVGVAVDGGGHFVTVERFLQPARAEERENFRRLAFDGAAD